MPERFKSKVDDFNTDLWGHHFMVPESIAENYIDGDNRRIKCRLNDSVEIRAALMPSKYGWYVLLNKKIRDQLGLEEGDDLEIVIEKDDSEFGMDVPEEFVEVMGQEPEAWEAFQELTKGKQRSLIYIVNKVKNTDSRIRKALAIARHLRESGTNLDYKRLNELIRYYNNLK